MQRKGFTLDTTATTSQKHSHWLGGGPSFYKDYTFPVCALCNNHHISIYYFDFQDPKLKELYLWPEPPLLLLKCDQDCYQKIYWDYKLKPKSPKVLETVAWGWEVNAMALDEAEYEQLPLTLKALTKDSPTSPQIGGTPEFLQNIEDSPTCPKCNQSMDFLAQYTGSFSQIPKVLNCKFEVPHFMGYAGSYYWFSCFKCQIVCGLNQID